MEWGLFDTQCYISVFEKSFNFVDFEILITLIKKNYNISTKYQFI